MASYKTLYHARVTVRIARSYTAEASRVSLQESHIQPLNRDAVRGSSEECLRFLAAPRVVRRH